MYVCDVQFKNNIMSGICVKSLVIYSHIKPAKIRTVDGPNQRTNNI